MAVWQFDLWIIPRVEILRRFEVIPDYVELDWFEAIDWWGGRSEDKFISFFDLLLPRFDGLTWGKPDETFARLTLDDSHIEEVFVRIDLRNVNQTVLRSIVEFAKANEFMFFILESNRFLESEWFSFVKALNCSRASLFVNNPEKFLSDKDYLNKINREIRRKFE